MRGLILVAVSIRMVVLFMLLLCTKQLCGQQIIVSKLLRGVVVGLAYTLACMHQELYFLGNRFWYFVFTVVIALSAFGLEKKAGRAVGVFFLIHLILDGVASEKTDIVSGFVSVVALIMLYLIGFLNHGEMLVPVQLTHNGKKIMVNALRDTGNRLVDPVTGKPVMILGADVACMLTGLTVSQLRRPVEAVGVKSGLRLIPYNTIGQKGQLILAMQIQEVRVGKYKRSGLVAFAPEEIGSKDTYQALIGGNL